ncbi:type II secretion system F family protein [Sinomonas sp. P47F7]|uniref:type II secretion system F family protein n=1 Tax=Sinomonas sp. P47F7 TaxID=3410987 RepID=UPI003BF469DB
MTGTTVLAVLCGGLLGSGLWTVFVRLPMMRRATFADRVAAQLRSIDGSSRLLRREPAAVTPFGPLERIVRPVMGEAVARLSGLSVGNGALSKRLAAAGSPQSVADFRAEQLVWGGVAFAGATAAGVSLTVSGRISALLAVLLVLAATTCGVAGRAYVLSSAVRRRQRRILSEFPSVADMMALAVGAGETAHGALERTAQLSRGALSDEFRLVLADSRAGTPFVGGLQRMADRVGLAPITRFVDGLVVALERGTPLADVLRAQAQDVRDVAKRELMEAAGRKEIGMMVPLVFGVLPLTVIFAVYPGVAALTLGL